MPQLLYDLQPATAPGQKSSSPQVAAFEVSNGVSEREFFLWRLGFQLKKNTKSF